MDRRPPFDPPPLPAMQRLKDAAVELLDAIAAPDYLGGQHFGDCPAYNATGPVDDCDCGFEDVRLKVEVLAELVGWKPPPEEQH